MPPKHDPRTPVEEWFWDRAIPEPNTGCWLWTGAVWDAKSNYQYGATRDHRYSPPPMVKTHRLSWELTYGPIPDGLFVCHTCDTPRCINPRHFFLGTNLDNIRDAGRKGRMGLRGPQGREKKACKYGHPYTPENTTRKANGTRSCRQCKREKVAAWQRSERGREWWRHYRLRRPKIRHEEVPEGAIE